MWEMVIIISRADIENIITFNPIVKGLSLPGILYLTILPVNIQAARKPSDAVTSPIIIGIVTKMSLVVRLYKKHIYLSNVYCMVNTTLLVTKIGEYGDLSWIRTKEAVGGGFTVRWV